MDPTGSSPAGNRPVWMPSIIALLCLLARSRNDGSTGFVGITPWLVFCPEVKVEWCTESGLYLPPVALDHFERVCPGIGWSLSGSETTQHVLPLDTHRAGVHATATYWAGR